MRQRRIMDYALVQLSGNSKYQPVAVNGTEIAIDDAHPISAVTAGWGTTSEGSYTNFLIYFSECRLILSASKLVTLVTLGKSQTA